MSATAVEPSAPAQRKRRRNRRPKGRPTFYNVTTGKAIARRVSKGAPLTTAARALGVPNSTVTQWYSKGCDDSENGEDTLYAEFAAMIDKAKADWEIAHLENIDRCSVGGVVTREKRSIGEDGTEQSDVTYTPPQWQASAQLLKWSNPEVFGDKRTVEHTGTVQRVSINANVEVNRLIGPQLSSLVGLVATMLIPAQQETPADTLPAGVIETTGKLLDCDGPADESQPGPDAGALTD